MPKLEMDKIYESMSKGLWRVIAQHEDYSWLVRVYKSDDYKPKNSAAYTFYTKTGNHKCLNSSYDLIKEYKPMPRTSRKIQYNLTIADDLISAVFEANTMWDDYGIPQSPRWEVLDEDSIDLIEISILDVIVPVKEFDKMFPNGYDILTEYLSYDINDWTDVSE